MDKRQSLLLWLELLWWALTALIVYAILYPVHKAMQVWPFERWNVIFIVTLLTLVRYIFLLEHTFLAKRQVLKIVLLLAMFPFAFAMVNGLNIFLSYIEDQTWEPLTGHLPPDEKQSMEDYLWGEMLFFSVGSVIAAPAFAVRMMLSIWRTHNRGTV